MDVAALADLLRDAAEHHHAYEESAPAHDWADWYAAYVSAREEGRSPDEASDAAGQYVRRRS
jgi:hypothetical protein